MNPIARIILIILTLAFFGCLGGYCYTSRQIRKAAAGIPTHVK